MTATLAHARSTSRRLAALLLLPFLAAATDDASPRKVGVQYVVTVAPGDTTGTNG